jgi:hypothetical protein
MTGGVKRALKHDGGWTFLALVVALDRIQQRLPHFGLAVV